MLEIDLQLLISQCARSVINKLIEKVRTRQVSARTGLLEPDIKLMGLQITELVIIQLESAVMCLVYLTTSTRCSAIEQVRSTVDFNWILKYESSTVIELKIGEAKMIFRSQILTFGTNNIICHCNTKYDTL